MPRIKLGIDRIDEYLDVFCNKHVGLITNPTGMNSELCSTIEILSEKTHLVSLFSPEHGVRGDLQAGVKLDTYQDEQTGCTVYSLYGKDKKPSPEMLENIDIIAFDIQDVGARYYTFLYTMAFAMQAAFENSKKFVVFDRPNPVGGIAVEGNILEETYRSFIGYYPIPQRYGLTIGELALLFNKEFSINCDLTIITMHGYQRKFIYQDLELPWLMPSPNIPTSQTTFAYLATCYFEGTNVSEGRGTTKPFQIFGAPWLDTQQLIDELHACHLVGVRFRKIYFTPSFSKYKDVLCHGVELIIDDYLMFEPVKTGMTIIYIMSALFTEFEFIKPYKDGMHPMIDFLNGDVFLREHQITLSDIYHKLEKDREIFQKLKGKYHLYD